MIIVQLDSEQLSSIIQNALRKVFTETPQTNFSQPLPDQLLTIQQAAEILALSVPTIYGLVNRAAIPVSKKGKRLYFSKQELTDWVKTGRKKTVNESAIDAINHVRSKVR